MADRAIRSTSSRADARLSELSPLVWIRETPNHTATATAASASASAPSSRGFGHRRRATVSVPSGTVVGTVVIALQGRYRLCTSRGQGEQGGQAGQPATQARLADRARHAAGGQRGQ